MIRSMILAVLLAGAPVLMAGSAQDEKQGGEEPKTTVTEQEATKPEATGLSPQVTLETNLGKIVLELDGEKAPISTQNFLQYAESGFYVGTIFHRVIKTFMVQGGQFLPDMSQKKDGLRPAIKNEWRNGLKNTRGTIAMARTSAPHSATAQFYINVVDNGMLDRPNGGAAYAVFGRVIDGMDTVDKIRDTKVIAHPKYPSRDPVTPEEPVIVTAAQITRDCDRKLLAEKATAAEKAIEEADAKAKDEAMTGQKARDAERAKAGEEQAKKDAAMLPEFLKKLEEASGKTVQKTASGLMYLPLEEGTGASPAPTDTVVAHYTLLLLDGTKIQSSHDRGQPIPFQLNRVIPAWTEGVGLMKVGGKCKLICPPELAYGANPPPGSGIPSNATLVFDIELVDIK